MPTDIEYEADHLQTGVWAVRPKGQLGTCGFWPVPWTVKFVKARSAIEAINKVKSNAA